jgi:hypothetical protein
VVDGFRIEMTADEVIQHLETRIEHHRSAANECNIKRIRFEAVGAPPDDEEGEGHFLAIWPGYGAELERRTELHRHKEATLAFLRDHVIAREVYRLGERDLKLLELWPRPARVDLEG